MRRDSESLVGSHVARKLVLWLLVVTVPPAATLAWLGFELLDQDRTLMTTVVEERRRTEAQALANALDTELVGVERLLTGGPVGDGLLRLTFTAQQVTADPAERVLWLPQPTTSPRPLPAAFQDAERFEYGDTPDLALPIYEAQAASSTGTRAEALIRIARLHRQAKRWDDAIAAYERLAALGPVPVVDAPASLQARRALVSVLEAAGRNDTRARQVAALRADFERNTWSLDRAAWELTARDLESWSGAPVAASAERGRWSTVAEAVAVLPKPAAGQPPTRTTLTVGDDVYTIVSGATDQHTTAVVVSGGTVQAWLELAATTVGLNGAVSLIDGDGRLVTTANAADAGNAQVLTVNSAGLPWQVTVSAAASPTDLAAFARRRQLLSLGLVAILVLVTGGGYFLWRVMQRELAVGRLQTEFVAAVSHEFRTPLTSMRHVTDLLEESDDVPPARRSAMYGALSRNVDRLRRLVESLLDFSRMESGRKPYDLQPLDAGRFVAEVVDEFRKDAAPAGFSIELDVEQPGPLVFQADASALTNAIWNLLDNAVKYSPPTGTQTVTVSVSRHPLGVAVAVRDHGLGIPSHEQKEIFRRFVRGDDARRLGIKGTGLGLAMVQHVVAAHRGQVTVESVPGLGSTFTIVLAGPADSVRPAADESASFNGGGAPPPPPTTLGAFADAQGLAESPGASPPRPATLSALADAQGLAQSPGASPPRPATLSALADARGLAQSQSSRRSHPGANN